MISLFYRTPTEDSLTELIRRISKNSASNRKEVERLFSYLANHLGPKLKNYARGKGLEKAESEDIVQDVLKKVYTKLPFQQFENIGALDGYIWKIFENDVNKYFREQKKWGTIVNDIPEEEVEDFSEEIVKAIVDVLEWLDEKCKEILKMKYIEDTKLVEIASILNVKENTMNQQAKRCREKAKKYMVDKYKNITQWKI